MLPDFLDSQLAYTAEINLTTSSFPDFLVLRGRRKRSRQATAPGFSVSRASDLALRRGG